MKTYLIVSLITLVSTAVAQDITSGYRNLPIKSATFHDREVGHRYLVASYNVTPTSQTNARSIIKVVQIDHDKSTGRPTKPGKTIQTIPFHATLVDFDLQCRKKFCYLVVVISRTRQNLQLFAWTRTQFDSVEVRDTFAKPSAVRLFRIHSDFYIAVAQDQSQLSNTKTNTDYEDPTRFVGCAIFKFQFAKQPNLRYHQFIKLRFNPRTVFHYTSKHDNQDDNATVPGPIENNYIVFSAVPDWLDQPRHLSNTFIWSPINNQFWPHRFPAGISIVPIRPSSNQMIVKFPGVLKSFNQTSLIPPPQQTPSQVRPHAIGMIDDCFSQLERLLNAREIETARLMSRRSSLWLGETGLTDVSSRVVVHGNVIVRGMVIESPQVSLIGGLRPPMSNISYSPTLGPISPVVIDNELRRASDKLNFIRNKLSRAVYAGRFGSSGHFLSPITFLGPIQAGQVIFNGSRGVYNSNMRLRGLPFNELAHQLVSLSGSQEIGGKITFHGNVVADRLEIHGRINDLFWLKHALDITSPFVQFWDIEGADKDTRSGSGAPVELSRVETPELIMSPESQLNNINLQDFITRSNQTQLIFGRKIFQSLVARRLSIANPLVRLNGINLSDLDRNAIRKNDPSGRQAIRAGSITFAKRISANRLIVNNLINQQVNISSLIHDSVKKFSVQPQVISGHKWFLRDLSIHELTTDGFVNGVKVSQVFNLNHEPPVPDYARYQTRYQTSASPPLPIPQITGNFSFEAPVMITHGLDAGRVNNVDITLRAIRRNPFPGLYNRTDSHQLVRGTKEFVRLVRVLNEVRMVDPASSSTSMQFNRTLNEPLINGQDLKRINDAIIRQMQQPGPITIQSLEIEGNLHLKTSQQNSAAAPASFGSGLSCPIDVFRTRTILSGPENQIVEIPIRVGLLRAASIELMNPGSNLNGFRFPRDFVLKTARGGAQLVHGHKIFDDLLVGSAPMSYRYSPPKFMAPGISESEPILAGYPQHVVSNQHKQHRHAVPLVTFGSRTLINNFTQNDLQAFVEYERKKNSTGEVVVRTLTIHGNLLARRINGYSWPDDLLLKSWSSKQSFSSPDNHHRIYSPLVFIANYSSLNVGNNLYLRGPVRLHGYLNSVNLTQFAQHSVTFGDKDLFSMGRPLSNKVFAGGITISDEFRSQGTIDGVNFDELKARSIPIGPPGKRVYVMAPKVFMSDVTFKTPLRILYLNDLMLDHYLRRFNIKTPLDNISPNLMLIKGRKSTTGILRINHGLIVEGLINDVDFLELKARAISLSPEHESIKFNKTLTIEGDVFMDNLQIDERNGSIDGVKLNNMIKLPYPAQNNELVIQGPRLIQESNQLTMKGTVEECQITCQLVPNPNYSRSLAYFPLGPVQQSIPLPIVRQQVTYPPRPITVQGRNLTMMRSTPPYTLGPTAPSPPPRGIVPRSMNSGNTMRSFQALANRRPTSIQYEFSRPQQRAPSYNISRPHSLRKIKAELLEGLRKQLISPSLIRTTHSRPFLIGFIDSPSNDPSIYMLSDPEVLDETNYVNHPPNYLQLAETSVSIRPLSYHYTVGVFTDRFGQNSTGVFGAQTNSVHRSLVSMLPISDPNSAIFVKVPEQALMLLVISQDLSAQDCNGHQFCPKLNPIQSPIILSTAGCGIGEISSTMGGLHVYAHNGQGGLHHLSSAFFDLIQSIDLAAVDQLISFRFQATHYLVAVSRPTGKIYLLTIRGYTGYQLVSFIDAPYLDKVMLMYTVENFEYDRKPILVLQHSNGLRRILEPVII